MFENIREAFDGIWSHKLRSALTMLGVIIGIASIIAISSTIMGTNEQIKQNLVGAGNNTVEVALYQGDYALDPSYQQVPEYVTPLDASILPELLKIKQVEDASLFYRRDAYGMIWYGSEGLNQGSVYGVDEHFLSVNGYVIRSGRGFLPEDFAGYKKVALIDRTVSETLFMGKNPVNKTIEIMSEPYVVVGEFTQNSAFTPTITSINDYFTYTDHSGGKVLIPASTWPTLFSYDQPSSVVVRAGSTDDMTEAGKQTAALLNKTLTGSGDVTYKSKDLLEQAKKLQELSSATNRQLIWIASISGPGSGRSPPSSSRRRGCSPASAAYWASWWASALPTWCPGSPACPSSSAGTSWRPRWCSPPWWAYSSAPCPPSRRPASTPSTPCAGSKGQGIVFSAHIRPGTT